MASRRTRFRGESATRSPPGPRDPCDAEVERFYRTIPERGGRVLRVLVNVTADPWRVVTAFFDRSMRGEL
ncbi:MAG: hypothetical protein F4X37_10780 [Acidimicrobiia bacterium]|nr:hypothetical protein [Acidimicrobiia bacterium]